MILIKEAEETELRHLIELHEGREYEPYTDTKGNLTIGVGRNLTANGLSNKEIEVLLTQDLIKAIETYQMIFTLKTQMILASEFNVFRKFALYDMIFNLGETRFRTFKKLISAIEAQYFLTASIEMKDSLWYTQVGTRGEHLVHMMREGTLWA